MSEEERRCDCGGIEIFSDDLKRKSCNLLKDAENHRLNSDDREIWFENHIKIDNTNLRSDEVADMVIEQFKLVANEKEEKEYRFGV